MSYLPPRTDPRFKIAPVELRKREIIFTDLQGHVVELFIRHRIVEELVVEKALSSVKDLPEIQIEKTFQK